MCSQTGDLQERPVLSLRGVKSRVSQESNLIGGTVGATDVRSSSVLHGRPLRRVRATATVIRHPGLRSGAQSGFLVGQSRVERGIACRLVKGKMPVPPKKGLLRACALAMTL